MKEKTTITFPKDIAAKLKVIAKEIEKEEDRFVSVSELLVKAAKNYYGIKKEK